MGNFKLINVRMEANEYNAIASHYSRMGFEMIDRSHYKGTNYSGTVSGSNISVSPNTEDYYKCLYKFNMAQKNAKKLWNIYKKYKKQNREMERKKEESKGNFHPTKTFLPMIIVLAIITFFFVPMLFGNNFGEFVSWEIGLFSSRKSFDFLIFVMALLIAPISGFVVSLTIQLIMYAFSYKKRRLIAIEQLPILQKEIENLTQKANLLRI